MIFVKKNICMYVKNGGMCELPRCVDYTGDDVVLYDMRVRCRLRMRPILMCQVQLWEGSSNGKQWDGKSCYWALLWSCETAAWCLIKGLMVFVYVLDLVNTLQRPLIAWATTQHSPAGTRKHSAHHHPLAENQREETVRALPWARPKGSTASPAPHVTHVNAFTTHQHLICWSAPQHHLYLIKWL